MYNSYEQELACKFKTHSKNGGETFFLFFEYYKNGKQSPLQVYSGKKNIFIGKKIFIIENKRPFSFIKNNINGLKRYLNNMGITDIQIENSIVIYGSGNTITSAGNEKFFKNALHNAKKVYILGDIDTGGYGIYLKIEKYVPGKTRFIFPSSEKFFEAQNKIEKTLNSDPVKKRKLVSAKNSSKNPFIEEDFAETVKKYYRIKDKRPFKIMQEYFIY